MKKQWAGILSMALILVGGLLVAFLFINSSFETKATENLNCIEVNKVASFVYDVCYDAYTQSIFMDIERGQDNYRVTELQLKFFDSTDRNYIIKDIPEVGKARSYQISSPKNPTNIDITLGIIRDFSSPICEAPRRIFVEYCPSGSNNGSVNAQLNPLNGNSNTNNILLGATQNQEGSDQLSESLVEKEAAWKQQCESNWKCSDWETCYEGVQKRTCRDVNNCLVPTEAPQTNKMCGETCIENWECEWSYCREGYTTPTCTDKNKCGTTHDKPTRLSCGEEGTSLTCNPQVTCGEWSACEINYNFLDLSQSTVLALEGTKRRTCTDANSCISNRIEQQSCSASVDVYTQEFTQCGLAYTGIYSQLTNELLAQVRIGSEDDPSLDISLTGEQGEYCAYCYDGTLNGDEEGIDCGGSCISCTLKYGSNNLFPGQTNGILAPQIIATLLNKNRQSIFTPLHTLAL